HRPDAVAASQRAPYEWQPGRPTVAIVLGPEGANIADVLAPFEVFAATGRLNVVLVAPTSDPVTLTGGLEVVPQLTLADLDARLGRPPEVIVVPQINGSTSEIISWLQAEHRQGAPLIMGVCVGPEVLADAGLLDGRRPTAHWLKLVGLRRSHPEIDWTDGVRFVDDGDIITTAGVLTGIDGSLRIVERLLGADAAARVRTQLHWNGYRPGGTLTIRAQGLGAADLVGLASAAYRWNRPRTGVLLSDGVDELELAAAFRPYTEKSYLARMASFSMDGAPIRSRHGLTFLPRDRWSSVAPHLDRVLLPHADPEASEIIGPSRLPVVVLHRPDEFAFDGALRDIAGSTDVATARWVAKTLQYDVPDGTLRGTAWPWVPTITPFLLALVGAAAFAPGYRLARHSSYSGRAASESG
ncbi:MAG: DJ-1/PfpI family protein, partial [Microlunatus sp.]|nr:DJ-1/PfpI family protein [Microlunatus sp.]